MAEYHQSYYWPSAQYELFDRAQTYSSTPGHNGWTIADTSSGGTPTYVNSSSGFTATLASTSEVENVNLYHNDVLAFDIDHINLVEMWLKVANISSTTTFVFGLASARNDTPDTVAESIWFRIEGSASTSNVVVETDDGTNNNDDKATGQTLSTTLKKFIIDLTVKTSVKFYIDNKRVADSTTFDVSNYTGGLQPYFQIQKTLSTSTPSFTIAKFGMQLSKSFS